MSKSSIRWSEYAACMEGAEERSLQIYGQKLRKLARPRQRWENDINPYPGNVENRVNS